MNRDEHVFSYLDRRMSHIIDEWQLSTREDLTDLTGRLLRVRHDLNSLKEFEKETDNRLSHLEERVKHLQGMKNDSA